MSKEFSEPEELELDQDAQMDDYNPLDEAIQEKAYTKPNVRFNEKDMTTDIPEPSFIPPPMGSEEKPIDPIPKKPQEPFNPQMKELPRKDKRDAAGKMAGMIMTSYKWMNTFADGKLCFDEKRIKKMELSGELNLSVPIPISANEVITAGDFIEEFNEQSKGTIVVTQEFEDEVMPVLTEVLEKRGIGLTAEQQLMYLFGKDIAVKGFMVMQSLSVKKEMLVMLKEASAGQAQVVTPPKQQQQAAAPTQTYSEPAYREPTQKPASQEPPSVNDIVNQMTGNIQPSNQEEEYAEEAYQQPNVEVLKPTIISSGKPKGSRGRPKKNK
jgi:hypothetical protein